MRRVVISSALAMMTLVSINAQALWPNYPMPGIPPRPDGKPDLTAPGK